MIKKIFCLFTLSRLFLLTSTGLMAQQTVKLWDGNPPTSNEIEEPETTNKDYWITNVSDPTLTIYLPDKSVNTGMGVIICPGGGYVGLASKHEGSDIAKWLNTKGIAGFVLKYRMPNKHKEVPLDDAQQAIRYVRKNAKELGLNPFKIGIAGSSAGGHLASTASTHFSTDGNGISSRPDFTILFYPVITMGAATHEWSKLQLLGDSEQLADIHVFSNEKQVNSNTPPAILLLSDDDAVVFPENSILYYKALKDNNIPAAMYIFPEGGHGWGMRKNFKYHSVMISVLEEWLKDIGNK